MFGIGRKPALFHALFLLKQLDNAPKTGKPNDAQYSRWDQFSPVNTDPASNNNPAAANNGHIRYEKWYSHQMTMG